jgi:hypothetical protein
MTNSRNYPPAHARLRRLVSSVFHTSRPSNSNRLTPATSLQRGTWQHPQCLQDDGATTIPQRPQMKTLTPNILGGGGTFTLPVPPSREASSTVRSTAKRRERCEALTTRGRIRRAPSPLPSRPAARSAPERSAVSPSSHPPQSALRASGSPAQSPAEYPLYGA